MEKNEQKGNSSGQFSRATANNASQNNTGKSFPAVSQQRSADNGNSLLSGDSLSNVSIQMKLSAKAASEKADTAQLVAYTVNDNGGNHGGNEGAGDDFPGGVINSYYQGQADINIHTDEADTDEETGEDVSRQRALGGVIGNVDHIVPANLGGAGVQSNSRVIRADHNQSRQDDFYDHNDNHDINTVRMIEGGALYESAQHAVDSGVDLGDIDNLRGQWSDPWDDGALEYDIQDDESSSSGDESMSSAD